ncbi:MULTISPECIES: FMN-dependent NADH-azoreductase [Brevibacterium]|uniref:FMN dependent NADH:quinone oxidoreductase n=1 Tax=Brevibacterium salitolerans TaxID=1403566 RepID=A0ABN2WAK7_9MICO|nr:NAD(P)H-dependent oxidoreductase [Brevibacterium sp.]
MATLLRIDSSISGEASFSRRLTAAFAHSWAEAGGEVVTRDLHAEQIPHLPHPGLHFPHREGVPEDSPGRALQDELIEEALAADAFVIGAPLYNYSVPSTLRAWTDYLHVPGRTAGTPASAGPLAGRPVVLLSTRGAAYDQPGQEELLDHAVPALRALLGSALGMDVEAITVDRTLAEVIPALDRERASALFADALDRASARGRELAASLL